MSYPECIYFIPFNTLKYKNAILIKHVFFVYAFKNIGPDDSMQISLHKVEYEINVFIVFSFY